MLMRTLRAGLALLVVVACGCGGSAVPPTQPTPTAPAGSPFEPPFEPPIAGQYELTITASPSCSLPDDIRQRRYMATIAEPSRGTVTVLLSGADFRWGVGYGDRFEGTRDGDRLSFTVRVGELVDGARELSYFGAASATLAGPSINARLGGQIWLNVAGNLYEELADCTAADHTMSLVRR